MTTIAKAFSRIFVPTTGVLNDDNLIKIAIFCGAGLLISLLLLFGGVDLGADFLYF
jgi:hypothetical protein